MRSAGMNKDSMAQLPGFNCFTQHLNVLIEGPIGTGKTFIACALGQSACEHGISVRYYSTSSLFEILTIAQGDGSLGKLLAQRYIPCNFDRAYKHV